MIDYAWFAFQPRMERRGSDSGTSVPSPAFVKALKVFVLEALTEAGELERKGVARQIAVDLKNQGGKSAPAKPVYRSDEEILAIVNDTRPVRVIADEMGLHRNTIHTIRYRYRKGSRK